MIVYNRERKIDMLLYRLKILNGMKDSESNDINEVSIQYPLKNFWQWMKTSLRLIINSITGHLFPLL